jgi:HD-GYP domain-containing protein (c-di-GMP phosphodiesterase class II)
MTTLRNKYHYLIILILLVFTWFTAYMTNGINATINFFYFPVILASRFWGIRGGIGAGVVAGLLGGPFLPDNVAEDMPQSMSQWLIRLCFYFVIGTFAGKLFSSLNQKREEVLIQKQNLEMQNIEITHQRDEIFQIKDKIERQRDQIDNQKELIRQFSAGMIEALAQSIEIRDSFTRGHCQRVSDMSVHIGERMGIEQQELMFLRWSAMLHDIGKIGIPEHILNKEGKMTPDEYEVMKQHPVLGGKILNGIPYADRILGGVVHHHERLDGKGYPYGLSGDDIGLQARIIAVSDVWDAITSKRSYRDAMSYDEALKIMESGRGSRFDPIVLNHLLEILSKD